MNRRVTGDVLFASLAVAAIGVAIGMVRANSDASAKPASEPYRRYAIDGTSLSSRGTAAGPVNAPVTLVEFSDFECPFCRRLHGSLAELQKRYPQTVRVVFRHYPLTNHPHAFPAAIAAECAGEQGQFAPFARVLFEKQDSLALLSWEAVASRVGISDLPQFERCQNSSTIRARVEEDIRAGVRIRIPGTPVLVLGDRMMVGAIPLDTIVAFIRESGLKL